MLLPDPEQALALAREAIQVDPEFAMAHRLAAAAAFNLGRSGEAAAHVERAHQLRDRMSERERWHVQAFHELVSGEPSRAVETYELLLARYPDDLRAAHNLGVTTVVWLDDPERAYRALTRATELDHHSGISLLNLLFWIDAAGRGAEADSLARLADERGLTEQVHRWRVHRAFASGDLAVADAACDSLLAAPPRRVVGDDRKFCGAIDLARGRPARALRRLDPVARDFRDRRSYPMLASVTQAMSIAHAMRGDPAAGASVVDAFLDGVPTDSIPEPDRYVARTALRLTAILLEDADLRRRVEAMLPPHPDPEHWLARMGEALVDAAAALAAGAGDEALAILDEIPRDRRHFMWRPWLELLLGMVREAVGDLDAAAVHLRRASDPAWLIGEGPAVTPARAHLPNALRRLGQAEEARGDRAAAAGAYRRLLDLWADAEPELRDQVAEVRRAFARVTGESG